MGVSDVRKRSDPIADPTGESTFNMHNIWAPACLLQRTASRCPIVHSRHCPNSAVHHATLRAPIPTARPSSALASRVSSSAKRILG